MRFLKAYPNTLRHRSGIEAASKRHRSDITFNATHYYRHPVLQLFP
ncbi:hypothetical protein [Teredinibacter waterburyi]|nr:hypothetical protein [Teredinibacter waterburyi]